MDDLMKSLFENASTGVVPEDEYNTHVITEGVILDMLGGNREALGKVCTSVGKYCVRDGILGDDQVSAAIKNAAENPHVMCHAKRRALLAAAKEANDPDYQLYCKAFMLVKTLMAGFKAKYGEQADQKVAEVTKVIENNPRVIDAIDTANK